MSYTDQSHYSMFLDYFGSFHTFQTFDDKLVNKRLIRQLHGNIREHFNELADLNKKGAGYLVELHNILEKLDHYS